MVEGVEALKARFSKIPDLVREAVASEMERQAESVCQDMRKLAGSQLRRRTGHLDISIQWTWGEAPKGALVLGEVKRGKRQGKAYGGLAITIYAGERDAFYATFHEFGTVKMPARPFFFPVWRSRRKKVRAGVARALRQALRSA